MVQFPQWIDKILPSEEGYNLSKVTQLVHGAGIGTHIS